MSIFVLYSTVPATNHELRMTYGFNTTSGYPEIYHGGVWGGICAYPGDDNENNDFAQVGMSAARVKR